MFSDNKLSILSIIFSLFSVSFSLFAFFFMREANVDPIYINSFGFFLFFGYLIVRVIQCPNYIFSSFYQIYSFFFLLVAAFIVSLGHYMFEIERLGTGNGAFSLALLWFIVTMEFGYLGYVLGERVKIGGAKITISRRATLFASRIVVTLVILLGVWIFFAYSGPFFLLIDRVTYWRDVVPSFLSKYPSLLGQTFFIVVFFWFYFKEKGQLSWFFSAALASYFVLTVIVSGEKFSTFIIYIMVWLIVKRGYFYSKPVSFGDFKFLIFFFIALMALVSVAYSISDRGPSFILERVALQAQLLWSVLEEPSLILINGVDDLCFFGCSNYESGAAWISSRYLPKDLYELYSEIGTALSGFFPAHIILSFGIPLGLVFSAFGGLLLGFLQSKVVLACRHTDLISALLWFKILLSLTIFLYASKVFVLKGTVVAVLLLVLWNIVLRTGYVNIRDCRRDLI